MPSTQTGHKLVIECNNDTTHCSTYFLLLAGIGEIYHSALKITCLVLTIDYLSTLFMFINLIFW